MIYISLGNMKRFLNKLKDYLGNNYLKLTGGTVTGDTIFRKKISAHEVCLAGLSDVSLVNKDNGSIAKDGLTILDEGNYNLFTPTLHGTGATGTWDINISGNALNDSEGNKIVDTYAKKSDIPTGSNITVDSALSATSTNPVQNKVIKTELDKKWNIDSTTLTIHSDESFPLRISSTEDSRFSVALGSSALWIGNDKGEVGLDYQMISFKNEDSSRTIIAPKLDGVGTVQLLLQNGAGDITSAKNIATEDYVKTNYVPLSNGHISINGSELWVE